MRRQNQIDNELSGYIDWICKAGNNFYKIINEFDYESKLTQKTNIRLNSIAFLLFKTLKVSVAIVELSHY
jgi:hypothetical protein